MTYPPRHHPVFMLQDALETEGVFVEFNHRDQRTLGCWGLMVDGKPLIWLIDCRWPHEAEREDPAARQLIEQGALVCCAQKRDAERLGARWLPLAATPEYTHQRTAKTHDVGFVGYIRDSARGDVLALVASRYRASVQQGVFGDDAVSVYHQARAGLNVPTRYGDPLAYDVPMRVFEIAATGTPLVTNYLPELSELGFVHGYNCFLYRSAEDALHAVNVALACPDVGEKAADLITAHHTYTHRAKQVLDWLV